MKSNDLEKGKWCGIFFQLKTREHLRQVSVHSPTSSGAGRQCSTASWTPGTAHSACPPSLPPSLYWASWAEEAVWGPAPGCSRSLCGTAFLEEERSSKKSAINWDVDYPSSEEKWSGVFLTSFCQQQIVQVSVSYSEDVCNDTVTSWKHVEEETPLIRLLGSTITFPWYIYSQLTTALDVGVHHLRADAVGSFFTRRVLPEEALLKWRRWRGRSCCIRY